MNESTGVIIASIAVMITFFGILLADKRTRESNELTRKELNTKLRPWIRVGKIEPEFLISNKGSHVKWDEFLSNQEKFLMDAKAVMFSIPYENIGTTPALKVNSFSLHDDKEKITRNILMKNKKEAESPASILMPGEIRNFHFTIPYSVYDALYNGKKCFVGVSIEYYVDDMTISTLGKIWDYDRSSANLIDSWIDA